MPARKAAKKAARKTAGKPSTPDWLPIQGGLHAIRLTRTTALVRAGDQVSAIPGVRLADVSDSGQEPIYRLEDI